MSSSIIATLQAALYGNPPSSSHKPTREGVLAAFTALSQQVDALPLGSMIDVAYATRAELNADLVHAADSVGFVYGDATDANNDLYIKVGASGAGSWMLTTAFHDAIDNRAQPYVDAAQAISDALQTYLAVIEDVTGTGPVDLGYTGDITEPYDGGVTMGAYGNDSKIAVAKAVVDGPIERFELLAGGAGDIHLLVLEENPTAPTFNIVSSTTVTKVGSAIELASFTSADFGTINLLAGQWWGFSIEPSSGVIAVFKNGTVPASYRKYNPASYTSGSDTFATIAGGMMARVTQTAPTLQIGEYNVVPNFASLPYLGNPAPALEYDIWLIIGHSFAQGRSQQAPAIRLPAGVMKQYYSGALTDLTSDPVGNAVGSSPWPAFAQRYWAATGRGVIFVPCADGGSGLISAGVSPGGNWTSSGSLRAAASAAVIAAQAAADAANLPNRLGGVIPWVGMIDAARYNHSFSPYTDLLGNPITQASMLAGYNDLFDYFRTEFDCPLLPIVMPYDGGGEATLSAGVVLMKAAQLQCANADQNIHIGFDGARTWWDRNLFYPGDHPNTEANDEAGKALAECAAKAFVG